MNVNIQNSGLRRNYIDKFYTNNNAVLLCINNIRTTLNISDDDLIIEPSAGNGSFINEIKNLSNNYQFYDISPEHDEIIVQDYLDLDIEQFINRDYKIHIIGNPPFGKQSSLTFKFIKKSCQFCDTFSFILPKSFKKNSMKNKIPLNFHLVFENDIPSNSFLINDVAYDVPCVFQIWEKRLYNRLVPNKLIPINFQFVKKDESPDVSFRRIGINAGTFYINSENKSEESHYFIKFLNNRSIDYNLNTLNGIMFECNNTVGPKSISKQELIANIDFLLY